jgi:hypothetical protein
VAGREYIGEASWGQLLIELESRCKDNSLAKLIRSTTNLVMAAHLVHAVSELGGGLVGLFIITGHVDEVRVVLQFIALQVEDTLVLGFLVGMFSIEVNVTGHGQRQGQRILREI